MSNLSVVSLKCSLPLTLFKLVFPWGIINLFSGDVIVTFSSNIFLNILFLYFKKWHGVIYCILITPRFQVDKHGTWKHYIFDVIYSILITPRFPVGKHGTWRHYIFDVIYSMLITPRFPVGKHGAWRHYIFHVIYSILITRRFPVGKHGTWKHYIFDVIYSMLITARFPASRKHCRFDEGVWNQFENF